MSLLTPSRGVRVINGWIYVTKVDLAHEPVYLSKWDRPKTEGHEVRVHPRSKDETGSV